MFRNILTELKNWYGRANRKPVIIRGARQVGKTWVVRRLAEILDLQLIELNFEYSVGLKTLFVDNDPQKILLKLEAHFGQDIEIEKTLLFFDEIQVVPELLAKLRWFYEKMPKLAVIATGSLLDFTLDDYMHSMPVGRIEYLHLEPMTFEEFLIAKEQKKLCEYLDRYELDDVVPEVIHNQLTEILKEYVFVGGLPAAVDSWITSQSFLRVSEIHNNIIATYRDDFAKYAKRISKDRLDDIFVAVPKLLGKKFKFSNVNNEVNSSSLRNALALLCKARICHKVIATAADGLPLAASLREKYFKAILLDVGLVSASLGLVSSQMINLEQLQFVNQGGLSEQLVGQFLRTLFPSFQEPSLYYWLREKAGSEAELDYLIQLGTKIIPIEVKSGSTGTLRSLHGFMDVKQLKTAVRINMDYPNVTDVSIKKATGETIDYKLFSIPMYLVGQLKRIIGNAS